MTKNAHFRNAIEKYGWDNLVKQQVLIADEKYCLEIETKLRPNGHIGWNIVAGGGTPPKHYGNNFRSGKPSPNKGKVGVYQSKYKGVPRTQELKDKLKRLVTCPHCNQTGGIAGMSAHHFDNCKGGGKPYKARVTVNGERLYLGVFKTKEQAKMAQIEYYKEHSL